MEGETGMSIRDELFIIIKETCVYCVEHKNLGIKDWEVVEKNLKSAMKDIDILLTQYNIEPKEPTCPSENVSED